MQQIVKSLFLITIIFFYMCACVNVGPRISDPFVGSLMSEL